MDCLFCKIAAGQIPSEKVFENEHLVAFNDIKPAARVHVLVVPREHIVSIKDLQTGHKNLIGEMFLAAQKIAKDKGLEGYKLIINVGREGGQVIDHLHLHLLSGEGKIKSD